MAQILYPVIDNEKAIIQETINELIKDKKSSIYTGPLNSRVKYNNLQTLKNAAFLTAYALVAHFGKLKKMNMSYMPQDFTYTGIERGAAIDPKFIEVKKPCPATGCTEEGEIWCKIMTWRVTGHMTTQLQACKSV